MKKLLILTILLASTIFTGLIVEAKTFDLVETTRTISPNTFSTQIRIQIRNSRRQNRRQRVITRSRIVRIRNHYYRETYQIIYLRNGRTQTRLIRRTRIR